MRIAWSCYDEMGEAALRGLPDPNCFPIWLIIFTILSIIVIIITIRNYIKGKGVV